MKKYIILLFTLLSWLPIFAQHKTYVENGTTYYVDSFYISTGYPVVKRSEKAKTTFLKLKGYKKTPKGYEIDHVIPLVFGGTDAPSNMQLLSIEEHKKKSTLERKKLRALRRLKKLNQPNKLQSSN